MIGPLDPIRSSESDDAIPDPDPMFGSFDSNHDSTELDHNDIARELFAQMTIPRIVFVIFFVPSLIAEKSATV